MFNIIADPCPVQTMIGFDYTDKKKSVPFGPMSWPTGFQSGDDAEFIKKSNVMLGIADTSKFQAVVNTNKQCLDSTHGGACPFSVGRLICFVISVNE